MPQDCLRIEDFTHPTHIFSPSQRAKLSRVHVRVSQLQHSPAIGKTRGKRLMLRAPLANRKITK
jgi:hypothetical protein